MTGADPLSVTSKDYAEACASRRGGRFGALEAYSAFHRRGIMPEDLRDLEAPVIVRRIEESSAEGPVVKFTQRVRDVRGVVGEDLETESVLIPMVGRKGRLTYTLCVSSQVGCAMGCTFCETAQMGLIRSLSPGEIVRQWWAAAHVLKLRPANIVFMGMGEPMDNFDAVISAISVLTDHLGPGMPMSKITISTVGRVDGLRRLAAQVQRPGWHRLNLAVSLNAADDATRSAIMPVNRKYGLDELRRVLVDWPFYGGNKICFEYVLIPGVNDRREDAADVAWFMGAFRGPPRRAMVNVIPYNPRRNSPWPAPNEEDVSRFLAWLVQDDVYCKRRRTKGRDLMGACGQLGSERIRRRRIVALSVEDARPTVQRDQSGSRSGRAATRSVASARGGETAAPTGST